MDESRERGPAGLTHGIGSVAVYRGCGGRAEGNERMVTSCEPSTPAEATAQMLAWLNGDLLVQALYTAAALGVAGGA